MGTISPSEYKKYLNPSVLTKISSLELRAKLIVEGFLLGLHKSPYHGFSIEFSEHRQYNQGDAIKDIDWKIYGKTDRFYIKQYEEETNLKCYIVLDTSKSMAYSSEGQISKLEYASTLAASLSYLLLKQQDAVGLALYSDEIKKIIQPHSSNIYLQEILFTLSNILPSSKTETALSFRKIAEKVKKRGLVILISDFFDDLNSVINAIKLFRFKNNEVIVFQILDPIENNFAFGRDSIFVDLETSEELTTQPHQIQKAYQQEMNKFLTKIKHECLNSGIDYNLIETSQPFDKALYAFLQKRSLMN